MVWYPVSYGTGRTWTKGLQGAEREFDAKAAMTRSESYLALAILLMGQFVIWPRLGFLPDWGIGVVLGIWFFALLALAIYKFGPDE